MLYGSATSPIELFGPTRYQWDSGYFQKEIEADLDEQVEFGVFQKMGDLSTRKKATAEASLSPDVRLIIPDFVLWDFFYK